MDYTKNGLILLKISCILWLIWGFVHAAAGILTIAGETGDAISAIADGVDPSSLKSITYPDAVGAIINQHGFNLFWAGIVTMVGGVFIWKQNTAAIFITALIGGLFDIGYFVFIDLGGYNNFVPGTVMTIVSASAIILSFYAYYKEQNS